MSSFVPSWIVVEGGVFEGHQGHWADTFFSNATLAAIIGYLEDQQWTFKIAPMTLEQLEKYPEAAVFCQSLIDEYGTT